MSKSNLPSKLVERQENTRKETQQKVRDAIEMLREVGYENITIALLTKETGLSRSTFSKPHIEEILKEFKIGKFRESKVVVQSMQAASERQRCEELEKKLANANNKIQKLEASLSSKTDELNKAKIELAQSKQQLEVTVGNFQALYDRLIAMGIEIRL